MCIIFFVLIKMHFAKIQLLCKQELPLSKFPNVFFGDASELIQLIDRISIEEESPKKKTVKGYRVNVKYIKVDSQNEKDRSANIIRTIIDGMGK